MANSSMDDYNHAFYGTHYPMDSSRGQHLIDHQVQTMPFVPADHDLMGTYDYPQTHGQEMLNNGASTGMLPSQTNELYMQPFGQTTSSSYMKSNMSDSMLAYDHLSGTASSLSAAMNAGSAFAYGPSSIYQSSTSVLGPSPNPHPTPQGTYLQSQPWNLDPTAAYSTPQMQASTRSAYWGPSYNTHATSTVNRPSSDFSQPGGPSRKPLPQKRPQDYQSSTQAFNPETAFQQFIQPKRPPPMNYLSSNSGTGSENIPYTRYSSNNGFDMRRILAEVASRPAPKINLGALDLSCAFVLCDIMQDDYPIIFASEAFEQLTGYSEQEIIGRNCRFLQGPDGVVQQGMPRKFVDQHTVFRLRSLIEERTEVQLTLINYRKGGQPFINLVTMVPIRWRSPEYRFYVGFQVDLVEKPDAVTDKKANGTYMVNYQRNQLPTYVAPPNIYPPRPNLATLFSHEQVSVILDGLSVSDQSYRQHFDGVLVENTDDVIYVLSYDCEFLYLSPSCRKTLEYDPSELVGKTLSTVCHPSDIGTATRDLRACTNSDPASVVYRIRAKHSGWIWFESHGSWHIGERGQDFLVLVGRVRPVYGLDQIVKFGNGLLEENDVWAKMSLSGIILYISSKAQPVLGRALDDLIGKSIQDLVGTEARLDAQQALEISRNGQRAMFNHQIRHKKGHTLQAQANLYPGDMKRGVKPTFLVAQLRFPKSSQPGTSAEESSSANKTVAPSPSEDNIPFDISALVGSSGLPSDNQFVLARKPVVFTELNPARGSSWQFEMRELEKQNKALSDELQRLLTRKKRKRKKTSIPVVKSCSMCQTKSTPEWRRGPAGKRELCNSCGLRWAKQVRTAGAAQPSS